VKTKELAELLEPLHPCAPGLKRLLRYKTVREWWAKCSEANDLFYVWSFVATADGDDVFACELGEWERALPSHTGGSIMEEIVEICRKNGPSWFPAVFDGKCYADQFRAVFRCPTDAELRMAGRWFAGREW